MMIHTKGPLVNAFEPINTTTESTTPKALINPRPTTLHITTPIVKLHPTMEIILTVINESATSQTITTTYPLPIHHQDIP